jgi:alkylation response protein AidB-like acyl-CoA dehydrogenase
MRVALVFERGIATVPTGPTLADKAAVWAKSVVRADGSTYFADPVLRERLARIAIDSEISRLMSMRVAWMVETGGMPAVEGPMSKLFSTERNQVNLSDLVDLIGTEATVQWPDADGFPSSVESALRKSVVSTIYGGSSEVMREIIAERQLGLPRNRPGS